jgi:membrane protein DedA with SNARE-associated domain
VLFSAGSPMPGLDRLIDSWGYVAVFLIVVLGNLGLPVPEETVLTIGGYLAWQGRLELATVVIVAIVGAVAGDNMAYWLGRRYGQRLLNRVAAVAPERIERARQFIVRHGMLGVFGARFVAGLRFMAGPIAGSSGLAPARFFIANLLGAVVYVPVMVGLGYGIGFGLGERIEALRRAAGNTELIAVAALALVAISVWLVRARRARRTP